MRVVPAPGDDLVRTYEGERRLVELAQARLGLTDDLDIHLERSGGLLERGGLGRFAAEGKQRPFEVERVEERLAIGQPSVRGATAGACRGRVTVGFVRGRRAVVGRDDGRAVVARAARDARIVELQPGVRVQVSGGRGTGRFKR